MFRLATITLVFFFAACSGDGGDEVVAGGSSSSGVDVAAAADASKTDTGVSDTATAPSDTGGGPADTGTAVADTGTTVADSGSAGPKDSGAIKPVDAGAATDTKKPPVDAGPKPNNPGAIRMYGGKGLEEGAGMTRLTSGDLLLVGHTASSGAGNWDGLAVRVSLCGKAKWTKTYGGAQKDRFKGAAADKSGGAWVVGSTESFGSSSEALVARLDGNGAVKTAHRHGAAGYEEALGVAWVSDGGAAVVAKTYSLGPGTPKSHNLLVFRVSAAGKLLWGKAFGGAKDGDAGFAIISSPASGATKSFYLAGATESWGSGDDDVWVMRLDANGKHVWSKALGGPGDDEGRGIAAAPGGGVHVVGFTDGLGAVKDDAFCAHLDSNGNKKWFVRLGGKGDERAYTAFSTATGLYVGGRSDGFGGGDDGFLTHLTAAGQLKSTRRIGSSKSREVSMGIALSDGSIVLAGTNKDAGAGDKDAMFARTAVGPKLGCAEKTIAASVFGRTVTSPVMKSFTPNSATGLKSAVVTLKVGNGSGLKTTTGCADSSCK